MPTFNAIKFGDMVGPRALNGALARRIRDALPGISFIGFTGTPIELKDTDTRAAFGEYIDIHDIEQDVDDRRLSSCCTSGLNGFEEQI